MLTPLERNHLSLRGKKVNKFELDLKYWSNFLTGLIVLGLKIRLSIILVVFFIFCSAFAQDYGDAIVTGSIADARTLVPILASDSASGDVCSMIFNGLVKYDKDINIIGDV